MQGYVISFVAVAGVLYDTSTPPSCYYCTLHRQSDSPTYKTDRPIEDRQ